MWTLRRLGRVLRRLQCTACIASFIEGSANFPLESTFVNIEEPFASFLQARGIVVLVGNVSDDEHFCGQF